MPSERTHPYLFKELRKRNERRARVAKLLDARLDRGVEVARIAETRRKRRPIASSPRSATR